MMSLCAHVSLMIYFILQFLQAADGFACYSCSYSHSHQGPVPDTACVHLPEVFVDTTIRCGNFCVVREVFDTDQDQVVSFWRSCTDSVLPDTCSVLDSLVTCYHSCRGHLCNAWVRGQLHEQVKAGSTRAGVSAKTRAFRKHANVLWQVGLAFLFLLVVAVILKLQLQGKVSAQPVDHPPMLIKV